MYKNISEQHSIIAATNEEELFNQVAELIGQSRQHVAKAINTAMVYTYYHIGQYVVEFEQGGHQRADYGKGVLKRLSERLTQRYGKGWSVDTLELCRKLFTTYSISEPVVRNSLGEEKSAPVARKCHNFILPWSHYIILLKEKNPDARSFYEIEAFNQQWSKRQLQRQVASSLYERLALSRDKEEVMRLANEGQTIEKPTDIIKNPLVLEFVGLKPDASYSESMLESAIISKIFQNLNLYFAVL